GRVVDDQQIARLEQRGELAHAVVRERARLRVDAEEPFYRGWARQHRGLHDASANVSARSRAPGATSPFSTIETSGLGTTSGRASVARSASGIASACIVVSISPGSTLKTRTPRSPSSAARRRAR